MSEPTMEEVLELVAFDRDENVGLRVRKVYSTVWGDVQGSVYGSVCGNVEGSVFGSVKGSVWTSVNGSVYGDVWGGVQGKISGREWQFVETPKERAIRLIREGKGDEAIKVLEGE